MSKHTLIGVEIQKQILHLSYFHAAVAWLISYYFSASSKIQPPPSTLPKVMKLCFQEETLHKTLPRGKWGCVQDFVPCF